MARAYVVGWLNVISGTIEKAGIYSEPNPTPMMGCGLPVKGIIQ